MRFAKRLVGTAVLALALVEIFVFALGHGTTTSVVLATDGALGTASIATQGGQKVVEDSTGRLLAVYVDNSGRIAVSFANSFPSAGAWSAPTKSPIPGVAYARPAPVLVTSTSLRIIVEGGTGSGHVDDLPVAISRDSQSNILSVSFGSATILDGSGFGGNPSATLAHNGDILAAWNWLNSADSSRVKAFRWKSGTGWVSFSGSSTTPDDAVVDSSNRQLIFPSIIQRGDNHNVYVIGNRGSSSTSTTLAFNKASFDGTNWSWGAQNLSYETNAARGLEDSTSLTWDATKSQVVGVYDVSGSNKYGIFTLDASDSKVHADTPVLMVSDNDYGTLAIDSTGGYTLFVLDATSDGSSGKVGYTTRTGITWNTTLTYIDSDTNNIGISLRRMGSTGSTDLLYSKGSSAPTSIIFVRITTAPASLSADFTFTPSSSSPGQSVTFTATASGGTPPYTFAWNFGDGATGSGGTVSHGYSQTGSFLVKLTTTDNVGSSVTAQHTVTVGTFTFVATGDYGFSSRATANWNSMGVSGASFALVLGDMLYQLPPPTEQDWCNSFKSNISNVELIVGNHETFESNTTNGGGSINKFIAACPFTLGAKTGAYGFQYSFDYPSTSPLVRFIMVMPAVWNGTSSSSAVSYDNGTATQGWVGSQIDSAKSQGIPWVVVGMHKDCITAGVQGCEIDQDFMRFLISKKVDIVLQGHDHNYQRSKQLKCATAGVYASACVANSGSTGSYPKGAGTVFLIDGTGGDSISKINPSDSEFPYFARLNDTTFGYTKYTVSGSSIQATFVPTTGTFTDSWNITTATPDFTILANPTNLSFQAGSSGTSTVTLSGLAGFSGTVSLSSSVVPAGPAASLSPSSVSIPSGGTGTSTLTVSTTFFSPAGTYTVTVTGTSGSLSHSVSVTVNVQDFSVSSNPTVGGVVTFTASFSGGTPPYSFTWNFGDGSTGTGNPATHTYSVKGSATVTLTVKDSANAVTTLTNVISIAAQTLTANFSSSSAVAGSPVTFTATASGGTSPYTFSWTFGDSGTGTGSPVTHTYGVKGTFTVTLTTKDANQVTTSVSHSVTVTAQTLVVTVTCPTSGVTAGKPFTCTVSASGGTSPYTGTGTIGRTEPTKGTKTETFSITDANGVTASGSATVNVGAQPLGVTATCPTSGVTAGKPFNCTVSASGGTSPYTGTGTISRTEPTKGTKTETFSVTDANGVTASGSATVTVGAQPLVVNVTCLTSGVTAGKPFTCTVSASGGTSPYTGAGTISRAEPTKGTKTETFSVTDANGVTASGSATVTVAAQPIVTDLTFTPSSPLVGQSVNFTATASGGTSPYSFSWTFGDASTGTGSTVSHTYNTAGTFTVTLTTKDANNVQAAASHTVPVGNQALCSVVSGGCDFTVSPASPTSGKPATFNAYVHGGASPYALSWNFGDSATGSGNNTAHTYAVKGSETVVLTITDSATPTPGTFQVTHTVVVNAQPLVVTVSCPTSGVTAGKPFNCTVSATGGTTPYTGTGTFSVTQPVKGTFTEKFNVTDANHVTATGSATVTVAPQPMVVTVACPTSGVAAGKPFSCSVSATGGTAPYSGSGTFGVTEPLKGTFTERFGVTDANSVSASGSAIVTVGPQPLTVGSCDLTGTIAQPVHCHATANGGTSPYQFAWSAPGGSPLSGVGIDFNTTYAVKGTYAIDEKVTDANAATLTVVDRITIAPQALVVSADCGSGQTAGKPFNCTVSATGGTAPYTGTGTISRTEPTKGTKTETFSVTDANGVTASGSASVSVAARPLVVTATCPTSGVTAGKPFSCTISASGGTSPYTGTGTISRTEPAKGTKTETFNVTDANAVTASSSATVTVGAQPLVVTVTCPTSGVTAGKPFSCTVSASGGTSPYAFTWSVDGISQTQTGPSLTITFPVKGTHTVNATATDANGVTSSATATVNIAGQPLTGDFTFNPTPPTAGKPATFTASSSGGTSPYTFSWTFGDSATITMTGSPVSHTYSVKGTYTVTLTIKDVNQVSTIVAHPMTVSGQPLTGDFTFSVTTAGKPVVFNATLSGGTTPYRFAWTFGDGSLGSGASTTHTYAVKGTYTVTLAMLDANSMSLNVSRALSVTGQHVLADFSSSPASPTSGEPVSFSATASGGTSPYSFVWGFNDSGTALGPNVSHVFAVKGTYSVTLNVTDANGVLGSVTRTINVAPQPLTTDFSIVPTPPIAGSQATFTATASGGTTPYTFSWNFGDGTNATGATVSHVYAIRGSYSVTLRTVDANTATISTTRTVTVNPAPLIVSSVSVSPQIPRPGNQTTFTALVSGGTPPYTLVWDLNGDGVPDLQGNPVTWTYTVVQRVNVTVFAIDADNRPSHSVTITVTVSPLDPALFMFDWADYNNDGKVTVIDVASAAVCFDATVGSPNWSSCSYWDFNLNGRVDVVDTAFVAAEFDSTAASPYPSQGLLVGTLDPQWHQVCGLLTGPEQAYCQSVPP